jgi:glycine/serine hydroxymethyltransferase
MERESSLYAIRSICHVNKNTVPGDKSALVPHGLRLGR